MAQVCAHVLPLTQATAAALASSTWRDVRGARGAVREQIRPNELRSHLDFPQSPVGAVVSLWSSGLSPETGPREPTDSGEGEPSSLWERK